MPKRDYLIEAGDAIANRLLPGPTSYYICVFEDAIFCLPSGDVQPKAVKLARYTASQLNIGLSPKQWNNLNQVLRDYFKEI